jgi:hypothetical protein
MCTLILQCLPGDHYVGRILAGLDVGDSTFQVLPPHFTCHYTDPYVQDCIKKCFGNIINKHPGKEYLPSIFMLLLASIVYHESWIRSFVIENNNHPFSNITILEDRNLLVQLKLMITINPTMGMPNPTGIPTHIKLKDKVDKVDEKITLILDELRQQCTKICVAVKDAIEENDLLSGNVTLPVLQLHMERYNQSIIQYIEDNGGLLV